jgi:hypothetical protein
MATELLTAEKRNPILARLRDPKLIGHEGLREEAALEIELLQDREVRLRAATVALECDYAQVLGALNKLSQTTAEDWRARETQAPHVTLLCTDPEIRALFNKAIGVQYRNKFSYSFETEDEAERAFHFIGSLGELQMSRPPPETAAEPSPCEHLRSELLAEKTKDGEPLFQMRKCLDCGKGFRVRSSLKAGGDV